MACRRWECLLRRLAAIDHLNCGRPIRTFRGPSGERQRPNWLNCTIVVRSNRQDLSRDSACTILTEYIYDLGVRRVGMGAGCAGGIICACK
jgi:hypothetical protein